MISVLRQNHMNQISLHSLPSYKVGQFLGKKERQEPMLLMLQLQIKNPSAAICEKEK